MIKTRVLHVVDKLSYSSGVASVVLNFWRNMNRFDFDFMLNEAPPEEIKKELKERGSRLYLMSPLRATESFKYIKECELFFKEHQTYKIIHGHVANTATIYLGTAKRNGIPYRILHSHNSRSADTILKKLRNIALNNVGLKFANRYIACSDDARLHLFGAKRNVKILHNAIDIERYKYCEKSREKIRKKLCIGNQFVIGTAGRMVPQKNQLFMLNVFAGLSNTNSILVIVGDGILREKLKQKASELNVSERIRFCGEVSNMNEYYSAMDVFILPSLFEGLPLTGIEAQANGLPCLFSNTITKEVKATEACVFLPINNADVWIDEVNKHFKIARSNEIQDLSSFNIKEQTRQLTAYYESLHNN